MAIDRFGRNIHYLRISLTDHCNLRCIYCMPEDMTFRPNADLMQDDEILAFTRLFASLGFDKIRLTGGEPTVRANVVDLVRSIASTEGIRSVSMTTNGLLLKKLAQPLAVAGLQRVNVSIDTLDPAKFKRLTRWGKLDDVWEGILAAEKAGLAPVKLNAVVVKGYNEDDVVDLAALTINHPWQMRFIEMMPFAGATDIQINQVITMKQIQQNIESEFGKLEVANGGKLDGEAQVFHIPQAKAISVLFRRSRILFVRLARVPALHPMENYACAFCVKKKWTCSHPCAPGRRSKNYANSCLTAFGKNPGDMDLQTVSFR